MLEAGKAAPDFTLLADADHAVAERYGTWGEKAMYGKRHMGVLRATFVIDAAGQDRQGLSQGLA